MKYIKLNIEINTVEITIVETHAGTISVPLFKYL